MPEKQLFGMLACPVCKAGVELRCMFMVCDSCKAAYAIVDGVPLMLASESWPLHEARIKNFIHHLRL